MKKEVEVFGVNYERFSVGKKLNKMAKKYNIKSVFALLVLIIIYGIYNKISMFSVLTFTIFFNRLLIITFNTS